MSLGGMKHPNISALYHRHRYPPDIIAQGIIEDSRHQNAGKAPKEKPAYSQKFVEDMTAKRNSPNQPFWHIDPVTLQIAHFRLLKPPIGFDDESYKQRSQIEHFFGRFKASLWRIVIRYERTAQNFVAMTESTASNEVTFLT